MKYNQTLTGYAFAITATIIWSGNFIIARGLNESIPPVSLAFWRWVVAVIVFLPFALKPLLAQRHLLKKHIPYLLINAFLGVSLFNTLIYFASHTTTAINLSLISITFPIFIVIFSRILFNELITLRKGLGILLVVLGMIFLISKGKFATLSKLSFAIGDIWMLIAAIAFAAYSLLLKRKPQALSIWSLQLSTFIIGLLLLLPVFLWETSHRSNAITTTFDINIILAILYVGIFASLLAFILWNKAIINIGPSKSAMTYYSLPIFSAVLAYLFLNEPISAIHMYSALFIITGIITANYNKK